MNDGNQNKAHSELCSESEKTSGERPTASLYNTGNLINILQRLNVIFTRACKNGAIENMHGRRAYMRVSASVQRALNPETQMLLFSSPRMLHFVLTWHLAFIFMTTPTDPAYTHSGHPSSHSVKDSKPQKKFSTAQVHY